LYQYKALLIGCDEHSMTLAKSKCSMPWQHTSPGSTL